MMTGSFEFAKYSGYGHGMRFNGPAEAPYHPENVLAIDALYFSRPGTPEECSKGNINRELEKVGSHSNCNLTTSSRLETVAEALSMVT